jgi:hypothetical protein
MLPEFDNTFGKQEYNFHKTKNFLNNTTNYESRINDKSPNRKSSLDNSYLNKTFNNEKDENN